MAFPGFQPQEGLYDPRFEHDACGVGFVADLSGRKSADILAKSIQVLLNLRHRGACGSENNTRRRRGHLVSNAPPIFRRGRRNAFECACRRPANMAWE